MTPHIPTHDDALRARLRSAWPDDNLADAGFTRAVMTRVNALAQAQRARQQVLPEQARQWVQRQQGLAARHAARNRQALGWGCALATLCWAAGSAWGVMPLGTAAWALGLGGLIGSGVLAWSAANLEA